MADKMVKQSFKTVAYSEAQVEEFSFEWEIRTCSFFSKRPTSYIESPTFGSRESGEEWCLRLYPSGNDPRVTGRPSVALMLKSSKKASVNAKCTFHAFRSNGEKITHSGGLNTYDCGMSDFLLDIFVDSRNYYHINPYVRNDTLKIGCMVEAVREVKHTYKTKGGSPLPLVKAEDK